MSNKIGRIYSYYQSYGIKRTVGKAVEKILKTDQRKYSRWSQENFPTKEELLRQSQERFAFEPKISIVVPLYMTPIVYLDELVESILNQTYKNWELCLSDGSGDNSPLIEQLKQYSIKEKRIKYIDNDKKLKISENTNCALSIATGDYIAFVDHDDLLLPNALYECVSYFNKFSNVQVIYTDEDKISMDGKKVFQPHFKPDFNRDLLNSTNYISHLFVVRRDVVEKVGNLNSEFDGAQDYDFILRCSENVENICHIPKVLYHWRSHMNSTAEKPESKLYAFDAGKRALEAHYRRIGLKNVKVGMTKQLGVYRTKYLVNSFRPLVSVIIPNKDHVEDLKQCVESILNNDYNNVEIIVVENNSIDVRTFSFYKDLEKEYANIRVLIWKRSFNYSKINNFAAEKAKGDYILFLNNDTKMIRKDCIEELIGPFSRKDIGIVGARLFYPDSSIQHAGVIVGMGGVAGHIFQNTPRHEVGYFSRIISQQDYSAITGACLMIEKELFFQVGGFDEKLAIAFNDIDLCLKVRRRDKLVFYNPYAELFHFESKSRGKDTVKEKAARLESESCYFRKKWKQYYVFGDPYYNKNLSLDRFDCEINI